MKSVRLFDFIRFDGASWQVVAQDGAELALKNLATDRIRRVSVAELLSDESYLPDSPGRLPSLDTAAVLETLNADAREQVEFLHFISMRSSTGHRRMPRPEPHRNPTTIWPPCYVPERMNSSDDQLDEEEIRRKAGVGGCRAHQLRRPL